MGTPTPVKLQSPIWIKYDSPTEPIELLNSEPTSKKLCRNTPLYSETSHFSKKDVPNLLKFTKDFTISKLSTEVWYGTLIWLKLWNSRISCFVLDRPSFLPKLEKNLGVLMLEKITKIGLMNTITLNQLKVKIWFHSKNSGDVTLSYRKVIDDTLTDEVDAVPVAVRSY